MTTNFIYQLEGPTPPERQELGHWGFSALLDKNFAVKLRGIDLDQKNYDRLNDEGRDIITKYGLEDMGMVTPYSFIEGSWLMQIIRAPGNSCDLAMACRDHESFLEGRFEKERKRIESQNGKDLLPMKYVPHNVDNMEQAFCMASLFTHWANHANIVFNS